MKVWLRRNWFLLTPAAWTVLFGGLRIAGVVRLPVWLIVLPCLVVGGLFTVWLVFLLWAISREGS